MNCLFCDRCHFNLEKLALFYRCAKYDKGRETGMVMKMGYYLNVFLAFLTGKDFLVLPFGHAMVFLVLVSFCLLLGKYKLGLLTIYCFVFSLGFVTNRNFLMDYLGEMNCGLIIYAFTGILMIIIFVIGLFQTDGD